MHCTFASSALSTRIIADLKFLCAPIWRQQTQQLQMLAMSNSDISPGTLETQQMRVMAPQGSQIRLRLRISFAKQGGEQVQDQTDFAQFPAGLTA